MPRVHYEDSFEFADNYSTHTPGYVLKEFGTSHLRGDACRRALIDPCHLSHSCFMCYQPESTAVQMRSIDVWLLKDGKLIELWDELKLLEVFQQIAAGDG